MRDDKKNTSWAHVGADPGTALKLSEALAELLTAEDNAVSAIEETPDRWRVEVHFGDEPDEALRITLRDAVEAVAGAAVARDLRFGSLSATDWVSASLAELRPVRAGRFVVHGAHDRDKISSHEIAIEIEAALAFGTGHHGTTRGCLLAIDGLLKSGRIGGQRFKPRRPAVLDIGAGSGVLAFAVAKALRAPVVASDIDVVAVRSAAENARLNGVAAYVRPIQARGVSATRIRAPAPYDLVFANILLSPLMRLARPIRLLLAPGARVILSGLLSAQANAAIAAYRAQGLALERRIPLDGWVTLVLRNGR